MLTQEHLDQFEQDGVIVIKNILTDEQVGEARDGLHAQLLGLGIDQNKVLSGEQVITDGVRAKGKASQIFYNKWKMDVQLRENIYNCMKELTITNFSGKTPFGHFDDVIAYIDRICWRLPDEILKEGGLNLHIDRNPVDPYLTGCCGSSKCKNKCITKSKLERWRPIQAFVSLTDSYGSTGGGLKVIKGFHKIIDEYFAKGS